MYLRPALKFVELIASISTEDETINRAPLRLPWGSDVHIASWLRYGTTPSAAGGGQEARGPPRVHNNGFYHYPPTLVDILELWNVLPATYCGRRYRRYRNEGRGYYQYEYRRYGQLDQAGGATLTST